MWHLMLIIFPSGISDRIILCMGSFYNQQHTFQFSKLTRGVQLVNQNKTQPAKVTNLQSCLEKREGKWCHTKVSTCRLQNHKINVSYI